MSGLYLHIPFCKQACHYCNFHFSTSFQQKGVVLEAMQKEIAFRQNYLEGQTLKTIYFGGGTPSLLTRIDLEQLFKTIETYFDIAAEPEITLEANPDDLNEEKLKELADSPINRLSIGVQSFAEADLQFMNRAHTAKEASACIENALKVGFNNLTIDLIYGSPTTSDKQWERNMDILIHYGIPHISSYCLTVEPQTALDHFVKTGKAKPVDEEQAARQFEMLMVTMEQAGYEHYEISNFAKPGWYAQHNSNYWLGASYLGIGPSAHSFNGESRQWNVANNVKYVKAISENRQKDVYEIEQLSVSQRYNEYVMTGLRTKWGCSLEKIQGFGLQFTDHFLKEIQPFLAGGEAIKTNNHYVLSNKGKLLADRIAMELFFE